MPKIEPEIIKQWREEFKLRTEQIETDANAEVFFINLNFLINLKKGRRVERGGQSGPRQVLCRSRRENGKDGEAESRIGGGVEGRE